MSEYKKLKRHPGYLALSFDERKELLDLMDAARYGVATEEQRAAYAELQERVRGYKAPTNRQKNNAKAREEAERRERKSQANAAYLQEHQAWNWIWPDEKGRFYTNATAPKHPLCSDTGLPISRNSYHGPSDHVVTGRARRHRRAHNYNIAVL